MSDPGLEQLAQEVVRRCGSEPYELAIVLGSGLGALAESVETAASFPYRDYACLRAPGVTGHAGRLVAGRFAGRRVLLFQGRLHLYQGLSAREATVPVRLAHRLGCPKLLLTNAAGGIHGDYRPGDFMYISDHLNFMGDNPLRGEGGDPFVDLSALYRQDLYLPLRAWAGTRGVRLHRGVLAALQGPSYETPAEVRALALLGADAVSMSTVPEAIMARYLGLEVVGISLIANPAAGLATSPLNHREVLAVAGGGARGFIDLAGHLIDRWCSEMPLPS